MNKQTCTKVRNPHFNECIHLSIKKPSLKSTCVGVLSQPHQLGFLQSSLFCEFTDKTPQIAEEKLIMMMDKAQEINLQI